MICILLKSKEYLSYSVLPDSSRSYPSALAMVSSLLSGKINFSVSSPGVLAGMRNKYVGEKAYCQCVGWMVRLVPSYPH